MLAPHWGYSYSFTDSTGREHEGEGNDLTALATQLADELTEELSGSDHPVVRVEIYDTAGFKHGWAKAGEWHLKLIVDPTHSMSEKTKASGANIPEAQRHTDQIKLRLAPSCAIDRAASMPLAASNDTLSGFVARLIARAR